MPCPYTRNASWGDNVGANEQQSMDSVELVRRALHLQRPERLPLVLRTDRARTDIINLGYNPPAGWQAPEEGVDEWGCRWANIIGTGLGQIVYEPLVETSDLARYPYPDPHAAGRYDDLEDVIAAYPGRYISASPGLSGFTRMMALRGFLNLMCDLRLEPGFVRDLADRVFAFEAEVIAEYARRGVHGIWLFDDLGTEHGLMMHPDTWREVFMPHYAAQARQVHALGMDYLLHSCGDVWAIIPDLIALGFDLLNLEQPLLYSTPEQNGIDRLAEQFGGQVCFCTNVDSQRTLITGTPEEVIAEAEHIVRAFARPEGGLIPLADCGKDHHIVPPQNVAAMSETFWRLARGARRG